MNRVTRTSGPNACTKGHKHGHEVITVDDARFCLGCLGDAEYKLAGKASNMRQMFFTTSKLGKEILALGVRELEGLA